LLYTLSFNGTIFSKGVVSNPWTQGASEAVSDSESSEEATKVWVKVLKGVTAEFKAGLLKN
jgi:hypothetical protein